MYRCNIIITLVIHITPPWRNVAVGKCEREKQLSLTQQSRVVIPSSSFPYFVGAYNGTDTAKLCNEFGIIPIQSCFNETSYDFLMNVTEATEN